MSASASADKATIFDEDIARLEKRRAEVEAERVKLLKGQIKVTGPDGSSLMEIDLGALSAAASDPKTVERNLRQTLVENPLMPVLDNSFKKTRELREEMTSRGELPAGRRAKSPFVRLVRANQHFNQVMPGKERGLSKLVSSPWWLLAGIILILVWCGGPLLYALSGGTVGGKPLNTAVPVSVPTVSPASMVTPTPTLTPKAIGAGTGSGAVLTNFNPAEAEPDQSTIYPLKAQLQPQSQDQDNNTPTPSLPPSIAARVGNAPSSAGGLNGPHGAFLAPSRMTIAALTLDTPVQRALTQNNNNGGVAVVSWPRPGEVVQTGAYPGEIGNMIVMGNQKDLGGLRRVQQNDEVMVYDRKGNAFLYRIVAFSADGQTEREVDPASLADAWVFAPTQEAVLTILVTYPQALPAVDPNQAASSSSNQVTVKDDYLTQKKLAYRAVLAMYAPAPVTPAGTPVAVPDAAWQTVVAAPAQLNTQTPIADSPTANPTVATAIAATQMPATPDPTTPAIVIPAGLPNTGGGGLRRVSGNCRE